MWGLMEEKVNIYLYYPHASLLTTIYRPRIKLSSPSTRPSAPSSSRVPRSLRRVNIPATGLAITSVNGNICIMLSRGCCSSNCSRFRWWEVIRVDLMETRMRSCWGGGCSCRRSIRSTGITTPKVRSAKNLTYGIVLRTLLVLPLKLVIGSCHTGCVCFLLLNPTLQSWLNTYVVLCV